MSIEWSKSLSTGVEWQDRQHKELFKRINSLLDAISLGHGKEEVSRLFNFLDEYFAVHFEAEENAMNKHNFPGTLVHIADHKSFIEEVSRIREESKKGITTALVIQVQSKAVDWLINHIGGIDKALGDHIKKVEKKENPS